MWEGLAQTVSNDMRSRKNSKYDGYTSKYPNAKKVQTIIGSNEYYFNWNIDEVTEHYCLSKGRHSLSKEQLDIMGLFVLYGEVFTNINGITDGTTVDTNAIDDYERIKQLDEALSFYRDI